MTSDMTWSRFTRCESNACVEWYRVPDGIALRSSKRPKEQIILSDDELATLVRAHQENEI